MNNKQEILKKRFEKLEKHYLALKAYKELIDKLVDKTDIYTPKNFDALKIEDKAILNAYLKRFSSVQDFLGAKIFSPLLDIAGINSGKMSEVLFVIEKEGIIDSLDHWIELREVRNELEHDYPDNLEASLQDLKFCINSFVSLESYYVNSLNFARKYIHALRK